MLDINQSWSDAPRESLPAEKVPGTLSMAGVLGNVTLGNEHQQFKPNPASMPFPYWLGVNFTPNHVVVAQIPYYLIQSMPNAQAISPNVGRNGLHELITKAK